MVPSPIEPAWLFILILPLWIYYSRKLKNSICLKALTDLLRIDKLLVMCLQCGIWCLILGNERGQMLSTGQPVHEEGKLTSSETPRMMSLVRRFEVGRIYFRDLHQDLIRWLLKAGIKRVVLSVHHDICTFQHDVSVFMQHAQRLYRHVYLASREENSGRSHYQALFTLLAVLSVELANEEVVVDLIRLILALQVGRTSVIWFKGPCRGKA